MTVGSNPTVDRSKIGTKRHILTDKNGIPLAVVITSAASTHDIKAVTDVIIMQLSNDLQPSYLQQKQEEEEEE